MDMFMLNVRSLLVYLLGWDSEARLKILEALLSDEMLTANDMQGIPIGLSNVKDEEKAAMELYNTVVKKARY